MNIALLNRRFANSSNIELISMALDEGYDSLAYALACRLEQNLEPDESDELFALGIEVSGLENQIEDLEWKISRLESDNYEMEQQLAKYEEVK